MDMTDAKIGAEPAEEFGPVAKTAVGHDAFSRNPKVRVVGERKLEKGDRASGSLIRHPGREGNAEMVFVADIQVFPSGFLDLVHAHVASGGPMARSGETTQIFISIWSISPGLLCSKRNGSGRGLMLGSG